MDEKVAWERLDQQKTQKLLARMAEDYWCAIEVRLEHKARQARIMLATSADPALTEAQTADPPFKGQGPAPNLQKSQLIEKQEKPTQSALQRRRVNRRAAWFDRFAGRLMYQAHEKLEKEGEPPSRHRRTPDLPHPAFMRIVQEMDVWLLKRKVKVPLNEVLSKGLWAKIANYNQRPGKGRTIVTLTSAAKHPDFKRAIRHRFNRAEIWYRQQLVQKQS